MSADGKTLATVLTNQDSSLAYYKGDGGAMISSTPLRISPQSLAWADEDHILLITRNTGLSKVQRATGTVQPMDIGDIDAGIYIDTCPSGVVLFTGIPKGGAQTRLFRMNSDGNGITQLTTTGIARAPYCSPDSQKAYVTIRDQAQGTSPSTFWSVPLSGGSAPPGAARNVQCQWLPTVPRRTVRPTGTLQEQSFDAQIVNIDTQQVAHELQMNSECDRHSSL